MLSGGVLGDVICFANLVSPREFACGKVTCVVDKSEEA